jgi:hypothetical protein
MIPLFAIFRAVQAGSYQDAPWEIRFTVLSTPVALKPSVFTETKKHNGVTVIQFPCKASSNQQFPLTDLNNGYWSLKAMRCSHAVDVARKQQQVYGDNLGKPSPRRDLIIFISHAFFGRGLVCEV